VHACLLTLRADAALRASQADANVAGPSGAAAPAAPTAAARARGDGGDSAERDSGSEDESDGEYQDIGTARAQRGGALAAEDDEEPEEAEEAAAEGARGIAADAGVSDMDYLRSRVRAKFSDDDEDDEDDEEEAEDDAAAAEDGDAADEDAAEDADACDDADAEPAAAGAPRVTYAENGSGDAALARTGRIFCRNLPFTATEDELTELFVPFGQLASVHVVTDRGSGRSKGLAYVHFGAPACAVAALAALDKSIFQGRLLHLLPAALPPSAAGAEGGAGDAAGGKDADKAAAGASAYKAEKEARLKASAGDSRTWSTLFMRPDTVAAALAARYGVDKADVMEPGAGSAAVRLALGEAQLVADTKTELAAAGVDIAALEAAAASRAAVAAGAAGVARSNTVLLLKNLPFSADADELRALCSRFGGVARLLLPASRGLAIVEYLEPAEARAAFAGLAYKRYQHVPLYVEWAAAALLPPPAARSQPGAAAAAAAKRAPVSAAEAALGKAAGAAAGGAGAEEDAEDGDAACTLYVKNLAFATDDAALRRHFEAAPVLRGHVRAVRVARKPGKTPGSTLSAGYGFVELDSAAAAHKAMAALDGSALDGHLLKLQVSRNGAAEGGGGGGGNERNARAGGAAAAAPGAAGAGGTKLVVRNVAFEATKADLRALFAPFGQLKSLRLPRKFDGQHRGFAFVELTTRAEARAAFDAVGGTHLYGRHLVTEWALADEGVDELRARTAQRFAAAEQGGAKKRRV
jgi:multiple RNA-binding domain-containing protein 1